MKHPLKRCQLSQAEFLKNCPEEHREFHARLFRIGNATYRYHEIALSDPDSIPESCYWEWLEGLPANIRAGMEELGFEKCKNVLSFTRYVNERRDIGLEEYLREHLSPEDYQYHKEVGEQLAGLKE